RDFHVTGVQTCALPILEQAGIRVTAVYEVLIRRLKQDQPGQLGAISRAIAMAGASIEVMYSDHANRLILVVDDMAAASAATLARSEERRGGKEWRARGA